MHAAKIAKYFIQTIYFIVASLWGYSVLKETPWLPWFMGGNGDFRNFYINTPFDPCPKPVLDYSLYTAGYHFGDFIRLFLQKRDNSF